MILYTLHKVVICNDGIIDCVYLVLKVYLLFNNASFILNEDRV